MFAVLFSAFKNMEGTDRNIHEENNTRPGPLTISSVISSGNSNTNATNVHYPDLVGSTLGDSRRNNSRTRSRSPAGVAHLCCPNARRLERELESVRDEAQELSTNLSLCREQLQEKIMELAKQERLQQQKMLQKETLRLGEKRFDIESGETVWTDGSEFKELALRRKQIEEERADIRSRLMCVNQSKKKNDQDGPEKESRISKQRGLFNMKLDCVKRDENEINLLEKKLLQERALHEKKLKIQNHQATSKYREFPLLAGKYQLENLIGKGGFSEVYKAYCLETCQNVAIKIHEVEERMSETEKRAYVRHAKREFEIQKELDDPNIVALLGYFPITDDAFATVLEYCSVKTLDDHLKLHGALIEKEARGIVIQILSGLQAMNVHKKKIIHYDLKPSNLIYNRGELKITDFGLSKIIDEDAETVENTTLGGGTLWYLPPECLRSGYSRISSKVDVWSTGVILYEILYAQKPFGNAQSRGVMWNASRSFFELKFPPKKVSIACKECIERLLAFDTDNRPDVLDACNDSYLVGRRTNVMT